MGLLDELEGLAGAGEGAAPAQAQTGAAPTPGAGALQGALAATSLGGVAGLLQHLQGAGLGSEVASMLGGGAAPSPQAGGQASAPAPDQIAQALGPHLGPIAEQLGLSPQAASAFIARHLPAAARAL